MRTMRLLPRSEVSCEPTLTGMLLTRRTAQCIVHDCRTALYLPQVDDIMEKHEDIEVKCEFCGKRYNLTPEQIRAAL